MELSTSQKLTITAIAGGVITLMSIFAAMAFVPGYSIGYIEIAAVWTSYISTLLCVFQSRHNYWIGAISTILYSILFYQAGLYSSMLVNLYLPIALIYGWFRWGRDDNTRPVTYVEYPWHFLYIGIAIFCYAVIYAIMFRLGATLPFFDAAILIFTVLAQFLLDNKKLETWAVWAVVNILAIYVYSQAGLYAVTIQYVFFLINTIYGAVMWRQSKFETDQQALRNTLAGNIIRVSRGWGVKR